MAAVAFFALVGAGYILSALLRDHERVVALRREIKDLRADYERRIGELRDLDEANSASPMSLPMPIPGEVEIVDDAPASQAA